MDILYAVLCRQSCLNGMDKRPGFPTGRSSGAVPLVVGLVLIAVLVGSLEVASRNEQVEVAAASALDTLAREK